MFPEVLLLLNKEVNEENLEELMDMQNTPECDVDTDSETGKP